MSSPGDHGWHGLAIQTPTILSLAPTLLDTWWVLTGKWEKKEEQEEEEEEEEKKQNKQIKRKNHEEGKEQQQEQHVLFAIKQKYASGKT